LKERRMLETSSLATRKPPAGSIALECLDRSFKNKNAILNSGDTLLILLFWSCVT